MDKETFDRLTRGVGLARSRRQAVAGLAAGVLGLTGLGRAAAQEAVPQARGDCGDDCLRNTDCKPGLKCSRPGSDRGRCVAKNDSNRSCSDDRDCPNFEECRSRRCVNRFDCRGGDEGNRCNDNRDCRSGERCRNGRCRPDDSCGREGDRCTSNGDCCSALVCNRRRNRCER